MWVVPDCAYLKTKKEVTYHGQSGGASVRVASGVHIRTGGSRGERVEKEHLEPVDFGTVVLTSKHIYFQGNDKERFRVRLDKLVSTEVTQDGVLFQREGVRARPEAFGSYNARILVWVLHCLDAPKGVTEHLIDAEAEPDEMLDAQAASQAAGEDA